MTRYFELRFDITLFDISLAYGLGAVGELLSNLEPKPYAALGIGKGANVDQNSKELESRC